MNRENPNPQIVASKQHFDTLDGLRGVAALAVVIFHLDEAIEVVGGKQLTQGLQVIFDRAGLSAGVDREHRDRRLRRDLRERIVVLPRPDL